LISASPRKQVGLSIQRMIKLYEAWGKPDKAAGWKAKLPNTQPGK
jgi:hypothetical protein